MPHLPLHTALDERALSNDQAAAVQALLDERIASRKPAAYLTGEAWLQGVPFEVDARVIIPRSLIAECIAEGTVEGLRADVNVFDPARLVEHQPRIVHDFPGGAPRYVQRASGYRATLVNGTVSLLDGELTGDRGGLVLRHQTGPARVAR